MLLIDPDSLSTKDGLCGAADDDDDDERNEWAQQNTSGSYLFGRVCAEIWI
jgi:hypothetical protein